MTDLQGEDHGQFGFLQNLDLKLPSLSTFNYGPIEDLGTLDTSSVLSTAESFESPETLEIWSFPLELGEQKTFKLKSWETFYNKAFEEPRITYVSEGGPQVFDAILAAEDGDGEDGEIARRSGCVIKSTALISSLLELGLGRDSVLYRYEEQERCFVPLIGSGRISGHSLEAVQSLSAAIIGHGNTTKRLQSFIDVTQNSSTSFSTSIALTSSIATIIATLHAQVEASAKSALTLLQLQSLFQRSGLMLSRLDDIVNKCDVAESEEELLSLLYEYIEDSDNSPDWIRSTFFQTLASVSRPWLDSISKWLGLSANGSAGSHSHDPRFVLVREETQRLEGGKEMKKLEYDFEPSVMPNFISREDALAIFETGKGLRLLRNFRPEHPLASPTQAATTEAPYLEWQFSWRDMERIQMQAEEYESSLQKVIKDFDLHGSNSGKVYLRRKSLAQTEIATIGLAEETAKAYIHASIAAFEEPLPDLTMERGHNPLDKGIRNDLSQEEFFAPPLSLIPALSFNPVIASQALLVNRACLRLLFREHNIRSHFSLLHRYSLFGDGVFSSRLSHALFDPELESAERRKGRFRASISGLKLGSRDTWPPASSELRLALTGILTESYYESRQEITRSSIYRQELPGGLSFAVRDLPENELQRCMDPNSIEALDFLRLQYKPPPPLDAVITQASLAKYDEVFKLLLRAARMLFVTNQLFRDTKSRAAIPHAADATFKSFHMESHHFISAICRYFFNGIQANWNILQRKLEDVDRALDRDGAVDGESIHKLRDFHDNLLDRLLFTLILRKRQAQVMKLLEEIFSLILVFSRHARMAASPAGGMDGSVFNKVDLKETYEKFRKKVRVFVSVCRGLSERRGEGGTKSHGDAGGGEWSEDGGNTIGQLLLDFEMSGFYAK